MRNHKDAVTLASPPFSTRVVRMCRTGCRKLYRIALGTFLLVLPLGYYPDSPDSMDFGIGVYGGAGQVASVLRGCDGETQHAESSKFNDRSVSAWMALPPRTRSPIVIGVRSGQWESKAAGFAVRQQDGFGRSDDREISFTYINPHVNLETRKVGIGLGYMFGDVPVSYDHYRYSEDPTHHMRLTGHLRLGNIEKGYFAISVAESTPIVSGGGMCNLGLGYAAGRSVYMYSGLACGFQDGAGFLQQGRFSLSKQLALDASIRLGSSGGISEHAFSGGISYRFGLKSPAKP